MSRPSVELPEDTVQRVKIIADRSLPSLTRPRLPEAIEAELEDIERRNAACYAEAEELVYQIHRVTSDLEGGHSKPPPELAAIRTDGD